MCVGVMNREGRAANDPYTCPVVVLLLMARGDLCSLCVLFFSLEWWTRTPQMAKGSRLLVSLPSSTFSEFVLGTCNSTVEMLQAIYSNTL